MKGPKNLEVKEPDLNNHCNNNKTNKNIVSLKLSRVEKDKPNPILFFPLYLTSNFPSIFPAYLSDNYLGKKTLRSSIVTGRASAYRFVCRETSRQSLFFSKPIMMRMLRNVLAC